MTTTTIQHLIEQSLLDALGLLDEAEQAEFERDFAAAPPAVQTQVRREQTRLSRIDFLLPDVEPPADLRAIVLDAVRRAMLETIEEREPARERSLLARLRGGAAFVPELLPSRGVSPLWRAASIGCAAAAVVMAVATIQMTRQYTEIEKIIRDSALVDSTLGTIGGAFNDLMFNAGTRHVVFSPSAPDFGGSAVLLLDPESMTAVLVCRNLPADQGQAYRLVVVNDDGQFGEQLADFIANPRLMGQQIRVNVALQSRLAIVAVGRSGETLATVLMSPALGA